MIWRGVGGGGMVTGGYRGMGGKGNDVWKSEFDKWMESTEKNRNFISVHS